MPLGVSRLLYETKGLTERRESTTVSLREIQRSVENEINQVFKKGHWEYFQPIARHTLFLRAFFLFSPFQPLRPYLYRRGSIFQSVKCSMDFRKHKRVALHQKVSSHSSFIFANIFSPIIQIFSLFYSQKQKKIDFMAFLVSRDFYRIGKSKNFLFFLDNYVKKLKTQRNIEIQLFCLSIEKNDFPPKMSIGS